MRTALKIGFLCLLVGCAWPGPTLRAEEPAALSAELEGLSGEALLELVGTLAADEMLGRKTAFDGGHRVEEWVAAKLAECGLKPADAAGMYLEPFTYGATQTLAPIRMGVAGKDLVYGSDYNDLIYSGSGKAKAEVVFCGYGIHRPDLGWDDYAAVDVKGRIVLAIRGAPHARATEFEAERPIGSKSSTARERGAIGFLLVDGEAAQSGTIQERFHRVDLPSLWISTHTAQLLLAPVGRSYEKERALRDAGEPGTSVATGVAVDLEVNAQFVPHAVGHNAMGMLTGRDPDLRDEIVLVGAHMDHLGVDAAGRIYNGADDNASGTAVLLHLVDVLTANRWRPKRTIIFCAFGAKEQGLVGSRALAARYPFQGRIVAVLNMDMVGQGEAAVSLSGGGNYPAMEARLQAALPPGVKETTHFALRTAPNGDHWPFHERGVPAFFVATRGEHPNSHTPQDDVAAIRPECLLAAAKAVGSWVVALGECPDPLYDPHSRALYALREGPRFARAVFDSTLRGPAAADGTPGPKIPTQGLDARAGVSALIVDVPDAHAQAAWDALHALCQGEGARFRLVRRAADLGAAWQSGATALLPRVLGEGLLAPERLTALAALGYRWVAPFGEPPDDAQLIALAKVARAQHLLLDVGPLGTSARATLRTALGAHPVCALQGRAPAEGASDPQLLSLSEGAASLTQALAPSTAPRCVLLDADSETAVLAPLSAHLSGEAGALSDGERRQHLRSLLGGNLVRWLSLSER